MKIILEFLRMLQIERCNIAHNSTAAQVRIEYYFRLLIRIRQLHRKFAISESHVLEQHESKLTTLSTATFHGMACKFLSLVDANSKETRVLNQ